MNHLTMKDTVVSEGMKKNNDWEGVKQITINVMMIVMNNHAWGDDDDDNNAWNRRSEHWKLIFPQELRGQP